MRTKQIALMLVMTLLQNAMAFGIVHKLYVSPSGSDSNDGTAHRPLLTMQGAVARAITLQGNASIEGFLVNVSAGLYIQYEALEIDATLRKPIEFRGADSEKRSIVSGGMQTGKFTVVEDKLWRVRIPEVVRYGLRFEQIYVNGERRFRAQNPNRGEFAGIRQVWQIPIDSTNLGRDIYGWEVLNITPNHPIPFGNKCRTSYIGEGAADGNGKEALGQPLITVFHKWDTTRRPLLHVDSSGVMTIAGRGVYP